MQEMDRNLKVYSSPEVAAHYGKLQYLSAAEERLFERYIRRGDTILDLGVGGGRTTPYLAGLASRYVGADYSEVMVLSCRSKFPDLPFVRADAADLAQFGDDAFDVVVMAFNGLDYVQPDTSRCCALGEIRRVLKPGGVFIFSSHNPRAVLQRPSWNPKCIDEIARRIAGGRHALYIMCKQLLTLARQCVAFAQAFAISVGRCCQRLGKRAFWSGDGWMLDSAHGGLVTHYAIPRHVTEELADAGFELREVLGDDYPLTSGSLWTGWYYYTCVATAGDRSNTCA